MVSSIVLLSSAKNGKEYLLINSLELHNFRGFLKLDGLPRFNVIVGPNASGKTALLEAIFLASANSPEAALRLRAWRGLGQLFEITLDGSSVSDLWGDLFFGEGENKQLSILLDDSERGRRECSIAYDTKAELTLPIGRQPIDSTVIAPLSFKWLSGGKESVAQVEISEKGMKIGTVPALFPAVFVSSSHVISPQENASRYSKLSQAGKELDFLNTLQAIYPFVRGLSIEINANLPTIFATVDGVGKKIPIPLLGGGINKYLGILLGIQYAAGGVALIDEMENGFFYKSLPQVWYGVVKACLETNTQVFLTTHSLECLRAALPTITGSEKQFRLIRMERREGQCVQRAFSGHEFAAAIEQEIEFR
jgi:hypothetical protein